MSQPVNFTSFGLLQAARCDPMKANYTVHIDATQSPSVTTVLAEDLQAYVPGFKTHDPLSLSLDGLFFAAFITLTGDMIINQTDNVLMNENISTVAFSPMISLKGWKLTEPHGTFMGCRGISRGVASKNSELIKILD